MDGGRGGIKKRIAEYKSKDDKPEPDDTEPAPKKLRGGIKQRVEAYQANTGSASSSSGQAGSVGQDQLPMWQSMKKRWAKGKLSSKDVLELAQGATKQGATGFDRLEGMSAANAARTLRNVLGYPSGHHNSPGWKFQPKLGQRPPIHF